MLDTAAPLPLADKPSIAGLAFENMSDDPYQAYFADGLVDHIITTLSKLSGLLVIARSSSFVYRGRSVDAATIACFDLASSGFAEDAVHEIEKAMRLSPHYSASYLAHLGNAYRLSGRIDEAIAAFKAYDARSRGSDLMDLVIAYWQPGAEEPAYETGERLLTLRPGFTFEAWRKTQFRSDVDKVETEAMALQAAGLPMRRE